MIIKEAIFVKSSSVVKNCPASKLPEIAFVGRSNVGKSSLLNMLAGYKKLSRISSTPGKTRLINHFLINGKWHMVDLPGYGYARLSKKAQEGFQAMITEYLLKRQNLYCLFVLIDSRLDPQKIDLEFTSWLGENHVPFALCFTKSDKVGKALTIKNMEKFKSELLKTWESLPEIFITSSKTKEGREEILEYIEKLIDTK